MSEVIFNAEKNEAFREKAKALVAKMTLSEKCSQMLNWAPAIERLDIKAYNWWNEALHGVARAGVATVFPQAITMAGSFDEDLMEEVGDAIATEGRAKYNMQQQYGDTDIYKGLTFWSPNVNIFRDPRWGRGHETYGEDPYLTSRLGVRFINGLQGHDENHMKAAACAKHFAVHSGPEDLRHFFNAEVSKQDLYETYLPAFEACVKEAKVEAVMGAYNRTNGEPCCGSKTLLQDILRDDWGFEGHVTSDCWAIKDFYEGHKVVDGPLESVALAVNNGCDTNCGNLFSYLEEAVNKGLIKEETIDQALVRLFTTRYKLGIMADSEPTAFDEISYLEVDSPKMQELNRRVALESMVLLKNDGLLPLKKEKVSTIGVIGPNANNRRALVGNYEGTSSRYVTVLEGIQDYVGDDVRVLYSEGCHLCKDRVENLAVENDRISEVKGVCAASDVVICCLGLDSGLEGEEGDQGNQYASGDKPSLDLPGLQQQVLEAAVASGKPVILVLLAGSALAIGYANEHANAILYGGYPGAQGGAAIARILFGENCPEGKLPITFYGSLDEIPEFTDYSMKGRTYRYMQNKALYPFGYGLSYTSFALSETTMDRAADGSAVVRTTIENTGEYDGAEVIQVYVKVERDNTPNPQLKAFKKVALKKGEKKTLELVLPSKAFGYFDEDANWIEVPQECTVYVGLAQPDARSEELTGHKAVVIR
ncbi:MAG: glycoside hydrolase family 3 C-terminal domain-containing protein [Lachnospiraceae bacterium]|nr:glycoside hydrolase family 3 C-terminal domain-containing protein [Lachnospiraceae bacterium]